MNYFSKLFVVLVIQSTTKFIHQQFVPFRGFQLSQPYKFLLLCEITTSVWYKVFRWLERYIVIHQDFRVCFQSINF